jgi:predicted thioesterase
MKASFGPGVSKTRRVVVERSKTIGFMGEEGRVYSTPFLVGDIEYTCRDLIKEYADPDEDSVGIEVSVQHLAPTLSDMTVEITATVKSVEGRKVTFEVTAKDDVEPVSKGVHTRFIVDVPKTLERLKAKAAKHAGRTS